MEEEGPKEGKGARSYWMLEGSEGDFVSVRVMQGVWQNGLTSTDGSYGIGGENKSATRSTTIMITNKVI